MSSSLKDLTVKLTAEFVALFGRVYWIEEFRVGLDWLGPSY